MVLKIPSPAPRSTGAPPQERSSARERLVSLDVFRGATVAGMLLVNNPGTWSSIYPPLEHATWNGWTPTDLIFPFFLFIVGITTQISLGNRRARGDDESAVRRQIFRRGALIILFGLLLGGFPYFTWTDIPGNPDPSFIARIGDRLMHWRFPGVLQRIGIAYMISALIATRTRPRTQVIVTACVLVGYWFMMTALPVPGSGGALGIEVLDKPAETMAAYWDRVFLDWSRWGLGNHMWASSRTWDPEGVLSTAGAVGTCMFGNLVGEWIGKPKPLLERLAGLFAAGALAMMVGMVWNWVFPINKSVWTSSYVLFTGGMGCVALATIMWLVDVRQWKSWTKPFVIYGTNPMIAFLGSGLMARMIYSVIKVPYDGKSVSLESAIYQSAFASWLSPINASLAFAISFVVLWYAILWWLYKRNMVFKV